MTLKVDIEGFIALHGRVIYEVTAPGESGAVICSGAHDGQPSCTGNVSRAAREKVVRRFFLLHPRRA